MIQTRTIKKHILKNGLAVFYCWTPDLVAFEISMHINTGSRDETAKNNGVSHFLEHMMFRGSKKYPNSLLLARALESFGGETNAMTGTENTSYWLKGDSEKTTLAIECFSDFFLYPNYSDLEIERNVILQEMASDFNEEGESIDTESLAMSALFSEHPLENSIIGTDSSVRKLTQADMEEKRKHFYHPTRCALTIHTSLGEEETLKCIQKHFAHTWEHSEGSNPIRINADHVIPIRNPLHKPQNALCLQNNPDNQFALKLIFPTVGGFSRDVVLSTFLQRILDDGICTRLPANIRERYGLVYDISCDTQFFHEIGTFSIDAMVSEASLAPLLEKLECEFRSILSEAPSRQECEHIKYRYAFDLKQILESPARYLNREVSTYFMQTAFSLSEEIDVLNAVEPCDILNTAQTIFGSARRGLVLVGPRARKRRDSIEKFLSLFD
jgi:predicted Zn-dependent peptidase